MKKFDLCLHAGGHRVTENEVKKAETPEPSGTWFPIPHAALVDEVYESVLNSGYRIVNNVHALSHNGARYFGMLQVEREGDEQGDSTLVVGLRNSHDKIFPAALVVGSGVFVCDNLAFSGEIRLGRKHTKHIMRDLPSVVNTAVGKLGDARHAQEVRHNYYRQHELLDREVNDLLIRALDARVISSSKITKVLEQWRTPNHPEFAESKTAWRLYNAFTEVLKQTNIASLPQQTMRLHGLLDQISGLASADTEQAKLKAAEVPASLALAQSAANDSCVA